MIPISHKGQGLPLLQDFILITPTINISNVMPDLIRHPV